MQLLRITSFPDSSSIGRSFKSHKQPDPNLAHSSIHRKVEESFTNIKVSCGDASHVTVWLVFGLIAFLMTVPKTPTEAMQGSKDLVLLRVS